MNYRSSFYNFERAYKYHLDILKISFMFFLTVSLLQILGELVTILGELTLGELVKNWASW